MQTLDGSDATETGAAIPAVDCLKTLRLRIELPVDVVSGMVGAFIRLTNRGYSG